MALRNRNSAVDRVAPVPLEGFEHIARTALGALRWLDDSRVDYVVVGALAAAVRGGVGTSERVAIVPAPYGRNLDRLSDALAAIKAVPRMTAVGANAVGRIEAIDLVGPQRLTLRCGEYELDIEGRPTGVPSYQDVLFDAERVELAAGLSPEIASAEHIERYAQLRNRVTENVIAAQRLVRVA